MTIATRFAPSPTGLLHLGHAWSALFAAALARDHGGRFVLRIEDIDQSRCRPDFTAAIMEDLDWLGLTWDMPVRHQSAQFDFYRDGLDALQARGLLYPCFCTRKDIQDEIARSGSAPHGPEGVLYPGTCRALDDEARPDKIAAGAPYALRLDMAKAMAGMPVDLSWTDLYREPQAATPGILGDVVLARKDTPASYHLCVTLDDHLQGITHVTRGDDLFYASHLHRLLQHVLELDTPVWAHHPLLLDEHGKRFAKRDHAVTLRSLRESGKTPDDIKQMIRQALPGHGPWRDLLDG